ncbi:MAG: YfhO family protein [Prevotella sp.]|nr:YfhO family protein [Alistipes senegalensis]MCM1357168.1 YfhO family protein [Prevotella sp.]MCM1472540.1 YfhO family protein [Muribaculaceae bacterium]
MEDNKTTTGNGLKEIIDIIGKNRFIKFIYDKGILCFLLSFIIPAVIMLYAFSWNNIHPFGDRQMLVVDLWHQYYPFFRVEREKLMNGDSFLYSWQNGMGTNFLSLISYYACSPLNWLSVFFSDDNTRDALTYILIAKIGFSGAFFSCFLRYTYKQKNFSVCIFSTMFALCSYMLGYYWNVMWFDTIALFPLVMTGVVAICREGKWKLFTISLALSLFSSYYIGYFTCIFCVFMFAATGIIEPKGIKDFFVKLFIMVRSSIMGIALSAFMTLPAYFGLKLTHSADNSFPKDTVFYEKWTDIFRNLLSFSEPVKVEGLPNFACGMLAILLFGVFLFSNGIKIREKISVLVMLAVIVVSCNMNKLNYIWHGFHFTNQIPYRFAFIFSFVLVASAFRAYDVIMKKGITIYQFVLLIVAPAVFFYLHYYEIPKNFPLSSTNRTVLLIVSGVTLALIILSAVLKNRKYNIIFVPVFAVAWGIFFMMYADSEERINFENIFDTEKNDAVMTSLLVTILFFMIFALVKIIDIKNPALRNAVTGVTLSCVLGFELVVNSVIGVQAVNTSGYDNYPDKNEQVQSLLENIRQNDDELFYRTEMTSSYTLNDSALYGYYGLSQFSSSANVSVTRLMRRIGLYASEAGNRYYYRTSTPVVNSLFGIKYIISKKGAIRSEEMSLEMQKINDSVYSYKNKYPLSLGYMMNEDILSLEDKNGVNPFEFQNTIIKLATGVENSCFTAQPVALVDYNNITVSKSGYGNYSFIKDNENLAGSAIYSYDGVDGGYLYGYATNGGCDKIKVTSDGTVIESEVSIEDYPVVFPMGNGQAGTTADIEISAKKDNKSGTYNLMVYALKQSAFEEAYNKLADEQLNITSFSDDKISGEIDVIQDGILFMSMPYEKGWTVYVDGEKTETMPVLHSMMGARVSAGHHTITLEYMPEGLVMGVIVSGVAVIIFGVVAFLDFRRRRRRKENPDIPEETTEENITENEISGQEVENEESESDDSISGDELPRVSDTE